MEKFINAQLNNETKEDLRVFLKAVEFPIAVRSSSVLEDSHYQPFAGVFATYMLPNSADEETNLLQLFTAKFI